MYVSTKKYEGGYPQNADWLYRAVGRKSLEVRR
jgi:hypothetical protein